MDAPSESKAQTPWIYLGIAVVLAGLLAAPLVLLTGSQAPRPQRNVEVRKAALDALTDRSKSPAQRLELLQRAADDERRVLVEAELWARDPVRLQQDEHFTKGRLEYAADDGLSALAEAERGLGLGRANTLFVANLHALRGMSLEKSGEPAKAIVDYAFAVAVHRSLYEAALADQRKQESQSP